MMFFFSMLMTLSFMFTMLIHPLSLGAILLIQTILITLLTGLMNLNYWFSYIIFLVMIGGMLILFMYMTSIASNEKFKFSMKLFFLMNLMLIILISSYFIIDSYFPNLNLYNNEMIHIMKNWKFSLNKFLNFPLNNIFYMLIIYLLITLIMVVKITKTQHGPIRQKL